MQGTWEPSVQFIGSSLLDKVSYLLSLSDPREGGAGVVDGVRDRILFCCDLLRC